MTRALVCAVWFTAMMGGLVACESRPPRAAEPPHAVPPLRSPEIHADNRVTFRFLAPHASVVSLAMEGSDPAPMAEALGIWSVTTPPLDPDWYGYSFVVDGTPSSDPSNPFLKPNLLITQSVVHVGGPASHPWEIADVPHGVLHHHFYSSAVVGDQRDLYVYTPPDYEREPRRAFPVLYLLHGFSDDASAWSVVGRANVIVDNLIAQKRVKPMIVVMPLGYGAPEILAGGFSGFDKDLALLRRNFDKFGESLFGEVLPLVESTYRVEMGREGRAIAGLSMGGSESLLAGLNHLDEFAWIGSFSAGGLGDDFDTKFPRLDRNANSRVRLLWIACGVSDPLIAMNRGLRMWLQSKAIEHTGVETAGGHTWMVWRRNLVAFAGLLF